MFGNEEHRQEFSSHRRTGVGCFADCAADGECTIAIRDVERNGSRRQRRSSARRERNHKERSVGRDTRVLESNGDGFFAAPTLPAATYEVTVEMKGFQQWIGKGILLNSDDSKTLQIDLKVGAVTDSVVVESSVTELAVVDSGEKSALISQKELQQLTLVSRNASEFVKLLPGALLSPTNGKNQSNFSGQVVGINGFVPNGTNAGGLSAANINGQALNITQDGQNVFDPGAAGSATPVNPNPEMISEVKVLTSNFTAENPQGPVVVNTVTKGGGSTFHGSAYLDVRNSAMNAADHFNKEQAITSSDGTKTYPPGFNPKPPSSYYYPGASISGPVIIPGTNFNKSRQRLFFFEAYENYHQNPDAGVERAFVPTADMLNGDFSALATTTRSGAVCDGNGAEVRRTRRTGWAWRTARVARLRAE